jgi:hypothetical protein
MRFLKYVDKYKKENHKMVRLLKQVPLDFDWKLNEVWSGYINPHKRHKCNECEGLGYSKERRKENELGNNNH